MEAIVEYATTGILSNSLNVMENIAFGFIRNEIDRMKQHRSEVCERRRAAANTRWEKAEQTSKQTETKDTNQLPDANACKSMHSDAPYHISESVSESVSGSKSESENKSSTTSSGVRVRGIAGKENIFALGDRIGRGSILEVPEHNHPFRHIATQMDGSGP